MIKYVASINKAYNGRELVYIVRRDRVSERASEWVVAYLLLNVSCLPERGTGQEAQGGNKQR